MKPISIVAVAASVFLLCGCLNVFSPFDHATNDPQLISAARACLDQGDYACALQKYEKLSSSSSDVANSEEAYTLYNEAHLDMGTFIGAFGTGGSDVGGALTNIANDLPAALSDGTPTLLAIFHGYQKIKAIKDPTLRGIVRVLGGIGMISAIFSDMATDRGALKKTDLASDPDGCENSGLQCGNILVTPTNNPCHQPNDNVVTGPLPDPVSGTFSPTSDPLADASDDMIVANFDVLFAAIEGAEQGLSDLGVSSGKASDVFGALTAAGTAAFITDVPTNTAGSSSAPCFRQLLLREGIGN